MLVNCNYCGEQIEKSKSSVLKYKKHYCSNECRAKDKKSSVKVNCCECEREFPISPSRFKKHAEGKTENLFCSRECKSSWERKNKTGEKNKKYNRVKLNCLNCNEEYICKKYHVDNSNFCSRKCTDEYKSKTKRVVYNCIICGEERSTNLFDKNRGNGSFCSLRCSTIYKNKNNKKGMTKPEKIVFDWLTQNNIIFDPQKVILNKYLVDFYIEDKNIVIEVLGDYWHGNPKKYGDEEGKRKYTEKQLKALEKDRVRKITLENNGYKTIMIWEDDIYKDVNILLCFLIA